MSRTNMIERKFKSKNKRESPPNGKCIEGRRVVSYTSPFLEFSHTPPTTAPLIPSASQSPQNPLSRQPDWTNHSWQKISTNTDQPCPSTSFPGEAPADHQMPQRKREKEKERERRGLIGGAENGDQHFSDAPDWASTIRLRHPNVLPSHFSHLQKMHCFQVPKPHFTCQP